MAEYIERKAAIDVIMSEPTDAHYPSWYADKIKSIPAADVAPVRQGRWKRSGPLLECNRCGEIFSQLGGNAGKSWNYCPNCGAEMRGFNDE